MILQPLPSPSPSVTSEVADDCQLTPISLPPPEISPSKGAKRCLEPEVQAGELSEPPTKKHKMALSTTPDITSPFVINIEPSDVETESHKKRPAEEQPAVAPGNNNSIRPKTTVTTDVVSQVVGLENVGNNCYSNSVVQVLYNTPEFREHMLSTKYSWSKNDSEECKDPGTPPYRSSRAPTRRSKRVAQNTQAPTPPPNM